MEIEMKADLRSCIPTASDGAQLIIAKKKKITINFTLCSQGASRGEQEYYQNMSMRLTHLQRMLLNADFIPGHHTLSTQLGTESCIAKIQNRNDFFKINTLMYLHVDTQGAFVVFLFSAFWTSIVDSKQAELVFS